MFCLPPNLARQRKLARERDDVADLRSAGVLATAPGGHPTQIVTPELVAAMGDAIGPIDTGPNDETADDLAARILAHDVFVVTTLAYIEVVGASTGGFANGVHALRALHRAGVPLLAGTDATPFAPAHGAGLLRELALLVEAGLTATAALTAATSTIADRFGLTDRGRIAPGLRADLLLVDGDPTSDITTINQIAGVWRGGVRAR